MKTTTKLLSILLLIMLTQSCTKNGGGCETPQSYYIPLNGAQLNQTPYFTNPAFDTISFASDKGDTLTFVKTKTDTTWYEEQGNGNPDCGYDRVYSQTLRNSYTTIKGNGSFNVKHSKKSENGYPDNIKIDFNNFEFHINQNWLSPSFGYAYYIGNYSIKNRSYYSTIFVSAVLGDTITSRLILNTEFGGITIIDKLTANNFTLIRP
jgi:hypothetical protein